MSPVKTSSPGFPQTQVTSPPVAAMNPTGYPGMCCALNDKKSLQNSTYSRLVEEMQEQGEKRKVPVSVGKRNGLKLILDLHSNRASLGTLAEDEDVFNIFIGKVFKAIQKKTTTYDQTNYFVYFGNFVLARKFIYKMASF